MKNCLCFFLLFFFCASAAIAQKVTVNGLVIFAEDNEPIIGASVVVKGNTSIGTVTDLDGKFQLNVPDGAKNLVVSFVGMKTQEVKVKPTLKIVLESDAQQLGEVVVTGMQKMDKRLFTGATVKVDADKMKLDGVADVSRALEGRAAGVSVQNVSGTFGTAPKIRVRGATSIYGSSTPLWVVDGVIMESAVDVGADELSSGDAVTMISSAISGLNADDIESFQILKDGSATSIYGARAMAGVVVITTKRGKAGVSNVNYTGEFTMRMKPNYSNYNICNSQEQMGIYKEMQQKGWLEYSDLANSTSSGIYGRMYNMIKSYENGNFGLANTQAAMNGYLRSAEFRNTDWFDLLFSNSVMQNHAVSISTGSDKARMYASLSAMYDPGWTKSSNVERYTANVNASFSLSKYLTLNLLTNGSYRNQTAPGTVNQSTDVVSGAVNRGFDINPFSYSLNTSRTMDSNDTYTRNYSSFNIFDELKNNYIELGVSDLKFQAELNWKPVRGLELNALGAVRYQNSTQEHFVKDHSNQAQAYRAGIIPENATIAANNHYLYTDPKVPNAQPVTVLPEGGMYLRSDYALKQIDFRGTAQYNTVLDEDKHIINLFGGVELNSTDKNNVAFDGWAFCYDEGGIPAVTSDLFNQMIEENADYYSNSYGYGRSVAFFASGTYSYKGKYTLNLTGRYEGTNKLGKARSARWLPTYNIAGAWNMHEENWFEKMEPAFSHFTLKTSFSLTGDRGPSWVSNALPVYVANRPWRPLGETEMGLYLNSGGNSELTYEKKYEYNIGADMGFLNNRINFALDFYVRNNYDLIGQTYTQGAGGFSSKYANVATMKSHGVEFTLSTKNIVQKDFSWSTDFTFSKTHNEVTELATRSSVMTLISGNGFAKEGYPVRALFSIPFVGLNDEGIPQFINQDGEVVTSDLNFQEYEKLDFLKYEGPTDPTITGGFGNLFTYKNFRLNAFITYSFGNKIRLDPVFASTYSDMSALPKEFKNRWTVPGDEQYTDIPVIASRRQYKNDSNLAYAYNAYNYSTARIAKGDFIRMKEISLSYDLPSTFVRKIGLSTAALKIQATNLFLIYADKKLNGQDPEFINSGGVATPMPKQFTLTVRLGI